MVAAAQPTNLLLSDNLGFWTANVSPWKETVTSQGWASSTLALSVLRQWTWEGVEWDLQTLPSLSVPCYNSISSSKSRHLDTMLYPMRWQPISVLHLTPISLFSSAKARAKGSWTMQKPGPPGGTCCSLILLFSYFLGPYVVSPLLIFSRVSDAGQVLSCFLGTSLRSAEFLG